MMTNNGETVLPSIDPNILVRYLVKDPPEQFASSARLIAALALYGTRTIDFADALLAARALRNGGAAISFDRDFDRIPGLRRIQPA